MEIDEAQELFKKGNEAFVEDDYNSSVDFYTKAIDLDKNQSEFYKNRAHAYLKLDKYLEVKMDAEKSLELNQNQAKILLWKGIACFHLEEYENAINSFLEGQKINERDVTFGVWIERCEERIMRNSVEIIDVPVLPVKIKHDWYQTELFINITILVKNTNKEDVTVQSTSSTFYCKIQRDDDDYELNIKLAHLVDPTYCKWKVTPSKIEIQLKKASVQQWTTLQATSKEGADQDLKRDKSKIRAKTKNWDKIVVDMTKDDKDEGDGTDVLRQLYSDGNDEMKKAMNKSFVESGGTVLSTNWGSVSKKKYEIEAPDGLEWRQWDM